MYPDYKDITSKLGEPLWYYSKENCVPRYLPFHPDLCDVYSDIVALVVIRCQSCHREFFVSVGYCSVWQRYNRKRTIFPSLGIEGGGSFDILADPPRHDTCPAGDTMMSDFVRISEFWTRDHVNDWKRRPEYELDYSFLLEDNV